MASRPSWTGHLRISLVTFPVQLFAGFKSARNIPLRQIHKTSGKVVHNQPYVEGIGAIKRDDIIKGYEYKKGKYLSLSSDEVDAVRLPTTKIIDVVEFVNADEIDLIYYDNPYYVIPQGEAAEEAYAVFQQSLKETKKIAIGEVVLAGKEHLISIRPYGRGMLLETLRYADEVREAHTYFEDLKKVKTSADQIELAEELIRKKTSSFKIEDYDDSYEDALRDLIERKLKKLPIKKEKDYESEKVINLMDALKKSVAGKNETSSTKSSVKRTKTAKVRKPVKQTRKRA